MLPNYKNEAILKEKLLYAQTNCMQMNLDFDSIMMAPEENEVAAGGENLEPPRPADRRLSFSD